MSRLERFANIDEKQYVGINSIYVLKYYLSISRDGGNTARLQEQSRSESLAT